MGWKQILDDHKVLIDGVAVDVANEKNNLNKLPPTSETTPTPGDH